MTKRYLLVAGMLLGSLVFALLAAWGGFALWFQLPAAVWARKLAVVAWVLFCVGTLGLWWWHRHLPEYTYNVSAHRLNV